MLQLHYILNKILNTKFRLVGNSLQLRTHALIHSHFNYGIAVWGSTYPTYRNKLKLLQNKAIRIVTSSHTSTSSKPLYIKLIFCPCLNCLSLKQPKLFIFINLICYLKFSITTFYMLNLAILVPQDF